MVVLPKDFVETKYPGYFFNVVDENLYSVKVTGTLKPLAKSRPNQFNHFRTGWGVSVRGNHRWLDLEELRRIKPKPTIYPVWPEQMDVL